jgi:Methyltransferase domain
MNDAPPSPAAAGLSLPPHRGIQYRRILRQLHRHLRPRSYVEVGVQAGLTLELAACASIGVDPNFVLKAPALMGRKPALMLFQTTSDDFFARHDPARLLGLPHIDLFFLDGLHHAEALLRDFVNAERFAAPGSVIVLHDCLPCDLAMTRRQQNGTSPHPTVYPGAWTGDVWRVLPILRKYRPDLTIHVLDAPPTGLVLITGLDRDSTLLRDRLDAIIAEMLALDLAAIGLASFHAAQRIRPTAEYQGAAAMTRHFAPFRPPEPAAAP